MTSFLLAIQFLTIFPLKIKEFSEKKAANSLIYFPLAGLFIGFLLVGLDYSLCVLSLSSVAVNIILVVTLAAITGGMHLDGLSDTADAIFSARPKEEILAIMRDSHAGVMGVLAMVSIMLLKIALLSSVSISIKAHTLVIMCVLSRWSVVPQMFLFPYARRVGKAGLFMQGMNLKIFLFSTAAALLCAFAIWQIRGLIMLLIVAAGACLGGKLIARKISGITGDTLGATIELTEVITLFSICIFERSSLWIA